MDLDPDKIILSLEELKEICKGGMSHTCFIKIKPKTMTIADQIRHDLITAMKNKEAITVSILRMLSAAVQNAQIAKKEPLDELEYVAVIRKEIKKLQDTILAAKGSAIHQTLLKETQEQIDILLKYLPKSLTDEELNTIIEESIAEHGSNTKKDMGAIMKLVTAKVAGRAEPRVVSGIVKERLV